MANRFWVNDDADGLWNNANNWATTRAGTGGAGVPGSSDAVLFTSATVDNCTVDANVSVASIVFDDGTGKYTGTFDADTFDVTTSGNFGLFGGTETYTLRMGSGAWSVSGHFWVKNITIWGETATLTLKGTSKRIDGVESGGSWADGGLNGLIIDTGASIQVVRDIRIRDVDLHLKGDFDVDSRVFLDGGADLKLDAGVSLTGSSYIQIGDGGQIATFGAGATITMTRAGFGLLLYEQPTGTYTLPSGVYDAGVYIKAGTGASVYQPAGDVTFKKEFTIASLSSFGSCEFDCATNNIDVTFEGDVVNTASNTFTWTKGTGTITLSGSAAQSIDFDGQTVEDIDVDKSSGTASFTGDAWTCDSFLLTSGTVDFDA